MRFWNGCLTLSLLLVSPGLAQEKRGTAKEQQPKPAKKVRPADAKALFASFAKMPGLEARFVEEKYLALLVKPLESSGRLYFMRPGYLARVVEKPEKAKLTISPSELRVTGPDGTEKIDLRQSEDVRLFVTSLVRVFSGDRKALERSYKVAFHGDKKDAAAWRLTLTPRKKPLVSLMKDLTLHGKGFAVTRIVVREPNGDRTVTRIEKANPKRRFKDREKRRIFGIKPR